MNLPPMLSLTPDELSALADCISNVQCKTTGYGQRAEAEVVEAKVRVGDQFVMLAYDDAGDFALVGWHRA